MERFCDESLEQWIQDLQWASDDSKVRSLLQDIFHRRVRVSHIQARLWMRTIALFWRCGWSLREIGDQFGVDRQNIWRVVQSLRREARRFFGQDGQQPVVHTGPAQPTLQPKKEKPPAIQPDPENDSQQHWERVLESCGLADPDKPLGTGSAQWTNPRYRFAWRSPISVHAESWSEFHERDTLSKKPRFQRLEKTTAPRRQIGVKTIEIDSRKHQVKIFEAGRPAGCFRFWANPQAKQSAPDREYDAEETKGILAHLPTIEDVEQAIAGNAEAREFLEQYNQVRDSKSNPLRDKWSNPPVIVAAPQSAPRAIPERQDCPRCKKKRLTVSIYADGSVLQRCESSCAYMAVWRASNQGSNHGPKHKHDVADFSGLRVVRKRFADNPMNTFMPDQAAPEGNQANAP